jgi:hypothetical protein
VTPVTERPLVEVLSFGAVDGADVPENPGRSALRPGLSREALSIQAPTDEVVARTGQGMGSSGLPAGSTPDQDEYSADPVSHLSRWVSACHP